MAQAERLQNPRPFLRISRNLKEMPADQPVIQNLLSIELGYK